MYREEKQASRICSKRWQERSYALHRKKLADIKPSIDNKTPQMYPHLYQKLKKAQKEEEMCSEIERDNRTLVKRMTEIMQRPGIDTHNTVQPRSLNREARKRELLRITQENQKLLRRIQSRQPTYNHLHWEQEREKSETLCERICRYPYRPRAAMERNMYYYQSTSPARQPQADSSSSARVPAPPQSDRDLHATAATPDSVSESEGEHLPPPQQQQQPQHTPQPPADDDSMVSGSATDQHSAASPSSSARPPTAEKPAAASPSQPAAAAPDAPEEDDVSETSKEHQEDEKEPEPEEKEEEKEEEKKEEEKT